MKGRCINISGLTKDIITLNKVYLLESCFIDSYDRYRLIDNYGDKQDLYAHRFVIIPDHLNNNIHIL